ncbi:MAG: hypothetical protein CME38_14445 [Haliea sp.]|nr:hypothetical protein [Haliea sp.]
MRTRLIYPLDLVKALYFRDIDMRPNFLVIGAMKCGTTSMCHYLSQSRDVYVPDAKDIYFFSDNGLYSRGMEWYESCFEDNPGKPVVGEGTDDYSKVWAHPEAPSRIKDNLPDCKIIYMVRHPMRQMESAYKHRVANSAERLPFNQAITDSSFDYVATADYLSCLAPYLELFNDEQIRVIFNEDLSAQAEDEVASVLSFIGCDPDVSMVNFERMNTADGKFYDGKVAAVFRRSTVFARIAQSLPGSLKSMAKSVLTKRKPPEIVWERGTKKFVSDRLLENSREFLKRYGKPEDFWSFE